MKALIVDDLVVRYGDFVAVRGAGFGVEAGEIFGFLGPNGAGKTTTIKMLIGLLRPSAGVALIGGHDVERDPTAAKSLIGYVPDEPYLPDKLSAREFLQFIGGLYRLPSAQARRRSEELLKLFDLSDRADELIGGYSHGMRQKTALASRARRAWVAATAAKVPPSGSLYGSWHTAGSAAAVLKPDAHASWAP